MQVWSQHGKGFSRSLSYREAWLLTVNRPVELWSKASGEAFYIAYRFATRS